MLIPTHSLFDTVGWRPARIQQRGIDLIDQMQVLFNELPLLILLILTLIRLHYQLHNLLNCCWHISVKCQFCLRSSSHVFHLRLIGLLLADLKRGVTSI